MELAFDSTDLLSRLESMSSDELDLLPFGLIVMNRDGDVLAYNRYESRRAGISAAKVLGQNFFTSVGPCTNNYLIAQRYIDEPDLDDYLDFVFTLRMEPTPVRLRLLARADSGRQYLAVVNRDG
ncbi:MAG: hypothetical protein R2761_17640 [Acidimicrobiales bacterium]